MILVVLIVNQGLESSLVYIDTFQFPKHLEAEWCMLTIFIIKY